MSAETQVLRPNGVSTALMLILGGLIALPLTAILWLKRGLFTDPAAEIASGRVIMSADAVPLVQAVLVGAWAFGAVLFLYGLFRLLTGRRLPWVKVLMFGLSLGFLYVVYLAMQLPEFAP